MDISKSSQNLYNEGSKKIFELKDHFLRLVPFWLAGGLTALAATGYAAIFVWADQLSRQIFEASGAWYLLVPPVFFVLSWLLVEKFGPRTNGSGIPQLMASIEFAHQKSDKIIDKFLGFRVIVVKVASSIVGLIGGGSIGREGPTLQISGSIFHLVNKYWKVSEIQNRSAFLMAGAASGLASAFNTPLGGIVYVIEELAKSHLNSFRTGVLHAVIVAGIISQMIMGPYLYLGYPQIGPLDFAFMPQYITVAVLAALAVTAFSQSLKVLVIFRGGLKSFRARFIFTIMSGVLFALVVFFISKNGMGSGKDLLNRLLFSGESARASDVLSRFFGTISTYANGGAGGIFAPTLTLGGTVGSFTSSFFQSDIGPLSVLIGMAAGLAALTHSPLTSFILILEMTDRHKAIFPLMLAALIGHGLSKLISKQAFYEFVYERILHEAPEKNLEPAPPTA